MVGNEQTIQEYLNCSALIVRKYNLGRREFFDKKFSLFTKRRLDVAWTFASKEIQNREIIKDTSAVLNAEDRMEINSIVLAVGNDHNAIYEYLLSTFDVHSLKLDEENIERRARHILGEKYLTLVLLIADSHNEATFSDRASRFLKKYKIAVGGLSIFLFIAALSTPRILDGLTPPDVLLNKYLEAKYLKIETKPINEDVLTEYLHEESRYKGNGAICRDNWVSHSTGRGTCSHHGGVSHWYSKGEFSQTIEECRQEAVRVIGELKTKAFETSWKD